MTCSSTLFVRLKTVLHDAYSISERICCKFRPAGDFQPLSILPCGCVEAQLYHMPLVSITVPVNQHSTAETYVNPYQQEISRDISG